MSGSARGRGKAVAASVTGALSLFAIGGTATAQTRGPVGVEVDANIAFEGANGPLLDYATLTGVSLWYRVRPELSLGLTGEYLVAVPPRGQARPFAGGAPASNPNTILKDAGIAELFADVHFYPSTFFGWFARGSLGAAQLTEQQPFAVPAPITTGQRVVPILELQVGPELLLPLDRAHPRVTLVLRLRGTYTQLGSRSLLGVGAGAGVEF